MLKEIPETENTRVLRTDLMDDAAWDAVCRTIKAPQGDSQAHTATPADALVEEALKQIAQLAELNPPPRLSDRPLGIATVPCDPILKVNGPDEVEGKTFYCGVFTVPQNWDEPDGRNLDLSFVVAKASGENPSPDPLVFLAGGPGQSAVLTSIRTYDALRPTRDIVRLAQRGTAFGQRLSHDECVVLAAKDPTKIAELLSAIQADEEADRNGAAVDSAAHAAKAAQADKLCSDAILAQGLDLNQFTTTMSARDLVEFVKALGYTSYNLHGISYGSRLAMTIMRGVPGVKDAPALRSVVLDSTFPPSLYLLSSIPRNFHDPVLQMLDECEGDAACRAAYPDLKRRLRLLFDRLATEPIASDGQTVTLRDVVNTLTNLTNTRAGFMPRMIAELEAGSLDTYLALKRGEAGAESPEPTTGLDLSDPVQAFIAQALKVIGGANGMDAMFMFIAQVNDPLLAADPLLALKAYVDGTYNGATRDELLARVAALKPEDVAASPYLAALRKHAAAQPAEQKEEEELRQTRLLALTSVAGLLNQNIHCNEDYQFERLEQAVNAYNDLEFPELADLDIVREQAAICDHWPVKAAPIEVKDPVSSTVPTLILQGAYDVKTPVYMGRRAARELANSTLVLIPQRGHEIWTKPDNCAGRIAAAFVLDPSQKPDLSCLDALRPKWALPDNSEVSKP